MDKPPPPAKSDSLDSTWSKLLQGDPEHFTGVGQTSFWPMLHAASKFEDDDDESDESDSTESKPMTSDGPDQEDGSEPEPPSREPNPIDDGSVFGRLGQLAVNSYNLPPVAYMNEEPHLSPAPRPTSTDPSLALKVIQTEFGKFTREGEEEVLIKESDAALLSDTTILGMVHVTSHRVTFHASLLSTRPDLAPKPDVIKSGTIIFRKSFHRKQRRWLELSHDMLSLYKDSSEGSRIRPLRSILLSGVLKVLDYDSSEPTSMSLLFDKEKGPMTARFEFDTSEAAIDWHREIKDAVFMYRQRRDDHLYGDQLCSEAKREAGIRTCIPLHRIESTSCQPFLDIGILISFTISQEQTNDMLGDTRPTASWMRDFKVLVVQKPGAGYVLADIVKKRKEELSLRPDLPLPAQANIVTLDFGPLSFADDSERGLADASSKGSISLKSTPETREAALERKMRTTFALKPDAELFIHRAWLQGRICCAGYLVVSQDYICFWSKSYTSSNIRLRYPTKDVNEAKAHPSTLFGHHSLSIEIKGHQVIHFALSGQHVRDNYIRRINSVRDRALSRAPTLPSLPRADTSLSSDLDASSSASETLHRSASSSSSELTSIASDPKTPESAEPTHDAFRATQTFASLSSVLTLQDMTKDALAIIPKPINVPRDMLPPMRSRHFVCLTIGSRGDVQPYISLCRGLIAEGHTATIVTHEEYKDWVTGFGVNHRTAGGDPTALMKLSVEHSLFSPHFFRESIGQFRGWLNDLLNDSWNNCQDADVLIESPSAMAGVHIAEALNIPYIRAFTMPWTRTSAYPHAFLTPPVEISGSFNYSTYVIFDNIFWTAMSGQVNRWRKKVLQIPKTDLETLAQTKIPFIYNFSPSVVPKPLDWSDLITVSGYWFLDNPDLKWTPSPELLEFIAKAKHDGVPLVYIGFGSIVVPNPHAMTRSIYKGVIKAGVRAIISKGWSDRLSKDKNAEPLPVPPECFSLDKVPHDWLFPQLDAALHHGGAGTTGASLRAGIPTLIKPWFGDQFFWATRVHKLGAGLRIDNLGSSDISAALIKATSDRVMKEKAAAVGEKVRMEDGVHHAIRAIYTYMDRAAHRRTSL